MVLIAAIFILAALYSSVGHGGASGYLAAMSIAGVEPGVMRPAALVLNILVSGLALATFARAGAFRWRVFRPFAVTSVPAAYIAGTWGVPAGVFKVVVAVVLASAAVRLAFLAGRGGRAVTGPPALGVALVVGGALGVLSGVTGVGGGIYLSPLLLLAGWADARTAAGVSAAFICVNSVAGLSGQVASGVVIPWERIGAWACAAILGGVSGSVVGAMRLNTAWLNRALAGVLVIAAVKLVMGGR